MTIRDEYEFLKNDLIIRLNDASPISGLDYPFGLHMPPDEEKIYLIKGSNARLATKKSIIMIDNMYKKCRLFPSKDTAKTFKEEFENMLTDYRKDVQAAYEEEMWRFEVQKKTLDECMKYIDTYIASFKEAAKPFIKELETLKQEDIEKEIEARDKANKKPE